jgi:hypothetical protein
VADTDRDQILEKLNALKQHLHIPGWIGPFFRAPEDTVAWYSAHQREVPYKWEVWVELPDDPDVDHPEFSAEATRASVPLTDEELMGMDVPDIARKLVLKAAGRAAQETLEWANLKGRRVVDPHLPSWHDKRDLNETAQFIYEYLMKAGPRIPPV